ncbi:hypothetical protein AB1P65_09505 [Roseibium alexandrii]
MALDTYANLQTAIANTLNRSDLTSVIVDFITLAEAELNRRLRVAEMLTSTDITPSSGLAALPSDFVEAQKVTLKSAPRRVLDQVSTGYADSSDPYRTAGTGCFYSVEGSNLRITPSDNTDIELTYYQKIPALADDNTSNWLLAKQPGAYLYGALIFSAPYLHDDQRTGLWGQFFENQITALMADDTMKRYGQASRVPRVVL